MLNDFLHISEEKKEILIGDKIFENFMMVGCDKKEIMEFENENSNLYVAIQNGILAPKIISYFNNDESNNHVLN